jgi:mannosyltransferase
MRYKLSLAVVVVVILLAASVRFHLLGAQSLWNDEGNAYVQATRTFADITNNAAQDIHPPGYYWLLSVWRVLTGETEFALRALSVFASILTVALTLATGKRLYGVMAGLAAAVFVALNTFSIYYAQEARMYALLGLWSIASMWAFTGFIRTTKWSWALNMALLNAAGLWTHYAFPAVMVAQGVLFMVWVLTPSKFSEQSSNKGLKPLVWWIDWRFVVAYILANLLTIVLYAAWLPNALRQIAIWPSTGTPIPLEEALPVVIGWLTFGITYELGGATIAVTFFLLFGLLSFPQQDGRRTWWWMLLPVVWIIVTLGGFLVLELFREANLKFLLPAQIAYALWLGRGVWILWRLKTRRTSAIFRYAPKAAAVMGTLALVLGLWSGLDPLYHAPQFQRDDYRAMVDLIETRPNAAVILNAPGQEEVFRYYVRERVDVYPLPRSINPDNAATEAEVRQIIADYSYIYTLLWGTNERDPDNIVENTLNNAAYQIDDVWYGDVRLVRYATPAQMGETVEVGVRFGDHITLESYALSDSSIKAGNALQIRLDWTTDAPLDKRYKVFVQLLNPDGTLASQRDGEPVSGLRPTTSWTPGEIIYDNHAVIITHGLTETHYTLIVGLYNPDNPLERLLVSAGENSYFEIKELSDK